MSESFSVLSPKYSKGPHGLGDPDDLSLRKVEYEIMIPKKLRDIARVEKCVEQVQNFSKCCRESNIMMVLSCRNENSALKQCLEHWYQDPEFKERCKKEYLQERSEYRRTGIRASEKQSKRVGNMI